MDDKINGNGKPGPDTDIIEVSTIGTTRKFDFYNVPYTKFSTPISNFLKINRKNIDIKLNEAREKKLAIVTAPAGYGKSTAVSSWVMKRKDSINYAWITLDKEDNDAGSFWRNIAYSITQKENLAVYEKIASFSIDAIIHSLINYISAIFSNCFIILDDYHHIDSDPINRSFEYFLAYLPRNLHCILLSRNLPSFSIAKMIIDDEVTTIDVKDLQFSHEEIDAFLNKAMDLKLSDEEVLSLETKTEGWIAALKIAALSLKNCPDKSTFINSFSSNNRNLSQYLLEEIILCQAAAVKEFLMKTSILKNLNKSICDKLTGCHNSEDLLEMLETNHLFMISLDDNKTNYRYHHLLSDVLIKLLHKEYPKQTDELYLTASCWYEENGYYQDAFEYSIGSGNCNNTLRLLEKYYRTNHSSILSPIKLCHYFEAIPYEMFNDKPDVCINYAIALAATGQVSKDEKELMKRGIHLDSAFFERYKGQVCQVRSHIAMKYENIVDIMKYSELALQQLREHDLLGVGPCLVLGYIYTALGNIKKAESYYKNALSICKKTNDIRPDEVSEFLIVSNFYLSGIQFLKGELDDFIAPLHQFIAETLTHKNCMYFCLATAYYEEGDFQQAYKNIMKGLELYNTYRYIFFDKVKGLVLLARIMLQTNKAAEAVRIMNEIDSLVKPDYGNMFILLELPKIVNLLASLGVTERAEAYINKFKKIKCKEIEAVLSEAQVELFLAKNKCKEAVDLLGAMNTDMDLQAYPKKRIDLLLLEAIAFKEYGKSEEALACLQKALEIKGVERYTGIFADRGNAVYDLLIKLINQAKKSNDTVLSMKIEKVVAYFKNRSKAIPKGLRIEGSEQLSGRELEVLKLLAGGLSYDEIGNSLFVSLSTVKKHTGNIYYKLKAKNRIQAVNIAKANKLVE